MAATASQFVMLNGNGFVPPRKYRTVFLSVSSPLPSVSVRSPLDLDVERLAGEIARFQVLGRKNFISFGHVGLL